MIMNNVQGHYDHLSHQAKVIMVIKVIMLIKVKKVNFFMVTKVKVIMVIVIDAGGHPRSGTTLMRAMLDAHSAVRCYFNHQSLLELHTIELHHEFHSLVASILIALVITTPTSASKLDFQVWRRDQNCAKNCPNEVEAILHVVILIYIVATMCHNFHLLPVLTKTTVCKGFLLSRCNG